MRRGTSFGAPSPLELGLARLIRDAMASIDLVRFVSSGTEATMSALLFVFEIGALGGNTIIGE